MNIAQSIPSSISSTPTLSSVEPIGALLSKPIDWDAKIKQIYEIVMAPSRIVAADTDSLVEQVPSLIQLIGEVSKSDMKDTHQYSPWLHEDSANRVIEIFSATAGKRNFLNFLTRISTQFIFPLSSVPSHINNIFQTERELVFYNFLSPRLLSGTVGFLAANKSITLASIDYYFFAFAMLPLVDLSPSTSLSSQASGNTATTYQHSQKGFSGSPWWSSSSSKDKLWYDESKSGSIFERLFLIYCEIAIEGSLVATPIDPQIISGCQLALGAWIDFHLNPVLYAAAAGSCQLNFGKIFSLTSKICRKAILAQKSRGLGPVLINGVVRLLITLFTSSGSSQSSSRFVYRLDMFTFGCLVDLWYTVSAPWKILGDSIEKHGEYIAKYFELYQIIVGILQSIPMTDFVADFHHAKAVSSGRDFNKFLAHQDTKTAVNILVKIFEVIGPARDHGGVSVVDLLPISTGITTKVGGDVTSNYYQVIEEMWLVARQCTWHEGFVPKELSDESWRMDALVKSVKGLKGRKNFWNIFVWENDDDKAKKDTIDIPKKRKIGTNLLLKNQTGQQPKVEPSLVEQTWISPICSNEFEFLVNLLRKIVEKYTGIDLVMNPRKFSFIRKFADVGVLLVLSFSLWMYVSIAWCPYIKSGSTIAIVQAVFLLMVGLFALKLIGSQYIV